MITINLSNAEPAAIKCKRGDTFLLQELRFWSDAAKTIPLDISSYTFLMDVIDADEEVVLSFAGPTEFVISDTNKLKITKTALLMQIPASPTNAPYKYDLQMTTGAGIVSTIMKGNFTVEQDIT